MNNDKLDMQSVDGIAQNIEKIAALFPNCVTETAEGLKIDFDQLQQELSADIVEGAKERYRLDWPGKREAIVTANLPTTHTLRPVREDSVDFDTTENIYIEGDNLEVLKILQESYLNKIKMIYIDPPYNTGKDFVYKDNFAVDAKEWKEKEERDEQGNRLVPNPEGSGRYHSDWLTMMYPRLKLARNLLTEDGVIFISIDDNEVHNLRKICDEIFGEGNFVTEFDWRKKTGANDSKDIAVITESILLYAKNHLKTIENDVWERDENAINQKRFNLSDEFVDIRGKYYLDTLDRGGLQYSDSMNFGIQAPDGGIIFPNGRSKFEKDGWIWKWSESKIKWGFQNSFLEFVKSNKSKGSKYTIKYKVYQNVDNEGRIRTKRGRAYSNLITDPINQQGNSDFANLFNGKTYFSNPKPIKLIEYFLKIINNESGIILDFFSGSSSTAHAVMQFNADTWTGSVSGKRKYIMVQLPEETDEKSEAYKAGYKNICEIGKERIRRAAQKIKEEKAEKAKKNGVFSDFEDTQDYGFRVYRLDSSNMKDVFYKPNEFPQTLLDNADKNVKEDRSAEDLLTQIILDWGLPLSLPVERKTIHGKEVFAVAGNSLYACFDSGINEDFAKEVAKDSPLRIVFKDSGFKDDTAKENVRQLLKQLSSETEMKVI